MTSKAFASQIGDAVLGSDAAMVGRVKEVRSDDFLVDRPMQRDVYVPFGVVQSLADATVTLAVPAADVDEMGWSRPPLIGAPREGEPFVCAICGQVFASDAALETHTETHHTEDIGVGRYTL